LDRQLSLLLSLLLYCVLLFCFVLFARTPFCVVLRCIASYFVMLYCIALYCIVSYYVLNLWWQYLNSILYSQPSENHSFYEFAVHAYICIGTCISKCKCNMWMNHAFNKCHSWENICIASKRKRNESIRIRTLSHHDSLEQSIRSQDDQQAQFVEE
jgi:hypothetical protein